MANMKLLRYGSTGPQTELLQLALNRYGSLKDPPDGIFGQKTYDALKRFQISVGLSPDGIAGPRTWQALMPYLTGIVYHQVKAGETFYGLAMRYGSTVNSISAANPDADPFDLRIGQSLTIPLGFKVVPTNISFTSTVMELCVTGLSARYPFIKAGSAGNSVMGKRLYTLTMGTGGNQVFYNGSHHANEWITTPVLMKFIEEYALAFISGGSIFGASAETLYGSSALFSIPMVNPDGVDLVTGELDSGSFYQKAKRLSENYPDIPFPSGWKANINGTDLNLQYPAGWEQAKEIKFSQGYTLPGPRDYVGPGPLSAPESRAVYDYTLNHDFSLSLSYHTQGEVIYWKYLDYLPPRSLEIGREFSEVSGYRLEETPFESGNAGYKDWFIMKYDRPGYTIEAGLGTAPLPISQFDEIYKDNIGILTRGLTATA